MVKISSYWHFNRFRHYSPDQDIVNQTSGTARLVGHQSARSLTEHGVTCHHVGCIIKHKYSFTLSVSVPKDISTMHSWYFFLHVHSQQTLKQWLEVRLENIKLLHKQNEKMKLYGILKIHLWTHLSPWFEVEVLNHSLILNQDIFKQYFSSVSVYQTVCV